MDILLIAGLWLDATVWDDVVDALAEQGHRGIPVHLPGQGDGATDVTLDDQMAAVIAAVDAADGRPVVVGHSAASTLAWLAADARPDRIGRVVFVGGFPSPDGARYADFFDVRDGVMPFPGWEPFEGADSADLDEDARAAIARRAVAVPVGVSRGFVRLRDQRRHEVPAVLVCPEFTPDDVREWMASNALPELSAIRDLTLVDLDSGHWPMISQPRAFADALVAAAVD
jgi:pimeloyl-ACP methyl ester carboxylesterase